MMQHLGSPYSKRNLAIGAGVILLTLILLIIFIDWDAVRSDASGIDYPWLGIGALLLVIGYTLYAIRWHVLLIDNPPFSWTFHTANAGNLINLLLPLRPGDAARILMLGVKDKMSAINVTSSIIIERWYEQVMRTAALGGAIVFGVGLEISALTILGSLLYLGAVFVGMILLVRYQAWVIANFPRYLSRIPKINQKKVAEWIKTLVSGISSLAKLQSQLSAFLWSLACWIAFGGFHFFTLMAIFPNLSTSQLMGITFGSLALVPPSATTFPGYFQASLIIPLALVGFDRNLLGTFAIVLNIVEILVVVLMGVWGVLKIGIPFRRLLEISISMSDKPESSSMDEPVID